MIKILSWNIQQGGGSRLTRVMKALQEINAHVVVLSEFRNNASGMKLRQQALALNYRHQFVSHAKQADNSVIILSKLPGNSQLFPTSDPTYSQNILRIEFDAFAVYGMYLPHKKKHQLFDFLLQQIQSDALPAVLCGDFNSGINYVDQKGNSFWYEDEFKALLDTGCQDAFRALQGDVSEYSWYSHQGNGYRYDHTLVSDDLLPVVSNCYYLQSYREAKVSDHAPMVLEIGG